MLATQWQRDPRDDRDGRRRRPFRDVVGLDFGPCRHDNLFDDDDGSNDDDDDGGRRGSWTTGRRRDSEFSMHDGGLSRPTDRVHSERCRHDVDRDDSNDADPYLDFFRQH